MENRSISPTNKSPNKPPKKLSGNNLLLYNFVIILIINNYYLAQQKLIEITQKLAEIKAKRGSLNNDIYKYFL